MAPTPVAGPPEDLRSGGRKLQAAAAPVLNPGERGRRVQWHQADRPMADPIRVGILTDTTAAPADGSARANERILRLARES